MLWRLSSCGPLKKADDEEKLELVDQAKDDDDDEEK